MEIAGNKLWYQRGYTIEDIQSIIERHNLDGLGVFSHLKDQNYGDLSFLKDATFLKALAISSMVPYDLSFLPSLNQLHWLDLMVWEFTNYELFADLPLKTLHLWMWRKKSDVRVPPSLEELFLEEVNASSLKFIIDPQNVKSLEIKSSKIGSLDGIERFENLHTLKLRGVSGLSLLDGIERLEKLHILQLDGVSGLKMIDQKLPLTLKQIELVEVRSLAQLNLPHGLSDCYLTIKCCKKLDCPAWAVTAPEFLEFGVDTWWVR